MIHPNPNLHSIKDSILRKLQNAGIAGLNIQLIKKNFANVDTNHLTAILNELEKENQIVTLKHAATSHHYFLKEILDTHIATLTNYIETQFFLKTDLISIKSIHKDIKIYLKNEYSKHATQIIIDKLINEHILIPLKYANNFLYTHISKLIPYTTQKQTTQINRDKVLSAYNKLVKTSRGIKTVEIYKLQKELNVPIKQLWNFIMDENSSGNAELHKGDLSESTEEARLAAIEINGGKFLLVKFKNE
ncbi:MAG: hypothetical protein L3V56_11625 [Candidatus Magnetoovum sp. WYHC-5]|nr:hypothetical protein [Candidatus Magnetoovum sp. WYHC-5]